MIAIGAFIVFAAIGALARAELARRINRPAFPWGTMAVNVSGAFLLGALHDVSPSIVTVLGTGGLGAYTTFSSFAADTVGLTQRSNAVRSVTYISATVTLGVTAAAIGRNLLT